ncbi:MAG: GlsB/YeaQ/YmgE family stress response membrane protein [Coriobacteriia bacterium]|nr:GlsB/YeaQ/YmgE family stress response membrane protein [Coriobacteriia bacterium]
MIVGLAYVAMYLLVVGMAAGWLAWIVLGKSRVLKRGGKPNWAALLGLGAIGSYVGGLGVSLLMGQGLSLRPSGMVASFLGALAVVALYLEMQKRSK